MTFDFEEYRRKNDETDRFWNEYLATSDFRIKSEETKNPYTYNQYGGKVKNRFDQTVVVGDKEFDIILTHQYIYDEDLGWHVNVYSDKSGERSYEWYKEFPHNAHETGYPTKEDALSWAHQQARYYGSLKPYPGKEDAPFLVGGLTAYHWLDLSTPDGYYDFTLKWDQCCHLRIFDQYVHTDNIDELIDMLVAARDIAREHYKNDPNGEWNEG